MILLIKIKKKNMKQKKYKNTENKTEIYNFQYIERNMEMSITNRLFKQS